MGNRARVMSSPLVAPKICLEETFLCFETSNVSCWRRTNTSWHFPDGSFLIFLLFCCFTASFSISKMLFSTPSPSDFPNSPLSRCDEKLRLSSANSIHFFLFDRSLVGLFFAVRMCSFIESTTSPLVIGNNVESRQDT
ncbi:hypothetical protein ACB098_12G044700 [Castanea mollissima]